MSPADVTERQVASTAVGETTSAKENAQIENDQGRNNILSMLRLNLQDYYSTARATAGNTWFLRTVGVVFAEACSIVLLLYSIGFLKNFNTYGVAVSYFPWSWNVTYTSSGAVADLFYIGLEISLLSILISTVVVKMHFIPRFKSSFANVNRN